MELNEIQKFVDENPAVLLYFFNDNCAPCKILRPKVQEIVEKEFPKIKVQLVNAGQSLPTAAAYGVFSSPTLIVFFESKEYIRESKNISISELRGKISRIYNMVF